MPNGGLGPWDSRGEVVALYSFAFLFFAVAGGGAGALDRVIGKRTTSSPSER